jgi:hypothetical protein
MPRTTIRRLLNRAVIIAVVLLIFSAGAQPSATYHLAAMHFTGLHRYILKNSGGEGVGAAGKPLARYGSQAGSPMRLAWWLTFISSFADKSGVAGLVSERCFDT